jgi:hypothetical protein
MRDPEKKSWYESPENIVAIAAALFGIVISVLDMFDLLEQMPIRDKLPQIGLLATSLVLGFLVVERMGQLKRLTRDVQAIQDCLLHARKNWQIDHMHPLLAEVFGDRIQGLSETVDQAVLHGQIVLNDVNDFRQSYGCMLEKLPRAHFLATSVPLRQYFWDVTEEAGNFETKMSHFLENGGKFTRIFFVSPQQERKGESQEVLRRQAEAGVDVYLVDTCKVPAPLRQYFVVEESRRVAWEVQIDDKLTLSKMTFTTDRKAIEQYRSVFAQLMALPATRKYAPPAPSAAGPEPIPRPHRSKKQRQDAP